MAPDFSSRFLIQFLAAERGVAALGAADGDSADVVELIRLEVLDVVDLGELAAGVGGYELVELSRGLLAQVGAVHEEDDPLCSGVLDEAIGEAVVSDCGVRLLSSLPSFLP